MSHDPVVMLNQMLQVARGVPLHWPDAPEDRWERAIAAGMRRPTPTAMPGGGHPPEVVAASFIMREFEYGKLGLPAFYASWGFFDWDNVVRRLLELGHGRRPR